MDTEYINIGQIAPHTAPQMPCLEKQSRVAKMLRAGRKNNDNSLMPPIAPLLDDKIDKAKTVVDKKYPEYKKRACNIYNREKREARGADTQENATIGIKNADFDRGREGGQGGKRGADVNLADSRLKDPTFKASVRVVLEYLGMESNLGNFRKNDFRSGGLIRDWPLFAEWIINPRFPAIVKVIGTPCSIVIHLPGWTERDALKKLDTNCYEFEKWL